MKFRRFTSIGALLTAGLLGACSSSGSGSNNDTGNDTETGDGGDETNGGGGGGAVATANITTANASEVASNMNATLRVIMVENFIDFTDITLSAGDIADTCSDGGTASAGFDVDAAPTGEVSSGDIYAVGFDACDVGGFSIDGDIVYSFNTILGDPEIDEAWEVDIELDIDAFTFAFGTNVIAMDGNWNIAASQDGADSEFTLLGDFTMEADTEATSETLSLTDLALTCSYDSATEEATYTTEGVYTTGEIEGTVVIETNVPLVIADGDDYPSSGELQITGANDSMLTMTVIDASFVQLQVDEDGDGNLELDATLRWDAI